ncbi:hypothetical protein BVRB_9g221990 [Beta vulgaris subsp. vulgaris]|nr:hypothetical protein BVRB_9g221990 [Beta vulgaris subsp. vulgaris]
MKSMLEQYNAAKEESQLMNATSEAMMWKLEVQNLRGQLEDLKYRKKQLLGEELSDLSIEHLENLENQVQTGIKSLRARKEQLWNEKITELNHKEIMVHQENMTLHRELVCLRQQVIELRSKVYGGRKEEAKSKYDISNSPVSMELELSLSRQEVT